MGKQNWVKIFSSYDFREIELIRSYLLDFDIDTIILNKQDSMYLNLNSISPVELFAQNDDVIKAKHLINKYQTNE